MKNSGTEYVLEYVEWLEDKRVYSPYKNDEEDKRQKEAQIEAIAQTLFYMGYNLNVVRVDDDGMRWFEIVKA